MKRKPKSLNRSSQNINKRQHVQLSTKRKKNPRTFDSSSQHSETNRHSKKRRQNKNLVRSKRSLWPPDPPKRRLNRKQHIEYLAKPNWRRLLKPDPKTVPNLALNFRPLFPIPRKVLTHKASKRLKYLSSYVPLKYRVQLDYLKQLDEEFKEKGNPDQERIEEYSVPKRRLLHNLLNNLPKEYGEEHIKRIATAMARSLTSIYPSIRKEAQMARKLEYEKELLRGPCIESPEDKLRLKEWLKRRAKPKELPDAPLPEPREAKDINYLRIRFEQLAEPVRKKSAKPRDPFKVSKRALTYEASPRVLELAQPRSVKEPAPPEHEQKEKRGHTARTEELAKPKQRSEPLNIHTDEYIGVLPRALKAVCSARTKELAKPRVYDW